LNNRRESDPAVRQIVLDVRHGDSDRVVDPVVGQLAFGDEIVNLPRGNGQQVGGLADGEQVGPCGFVGANAANRILCHECAIIFSSYTGASRKQRPSDYVAGDDWPRGKKITERTQT
jgi:hypothetical protein